MLYTRDGRRWIDDHLATHRDLDYPGINRSVRAIWEQTALPVLISYDRIDLFYGPTDTLPLAARCKMVCAFRNPNIYEKISEWPVRERPRLHILRGLARAAGRCASRSIFVTSTSRDSIARFLAIPRHRTKVIHHGIGDTFQDALSEPSPIERPYLLSVSSVYYYKNFVRLIEAYFQLRRSAGIPHALIIIGAPVDAGYWSKMRQVVRELELSDHVFLLGQVEYPGVARWYMHAQVSIFPTYRETFGHPVLEAFAAGTPLACSNIDVLKEVGGDVPVYFDPFDTSQIADAIEKLLASDNTARIQRGLQRAAEFSWTRAAEETLSVFDEALEET